MVEFQIVGIPLDNRFQCEARCHGKTGDNGCFIKKLVSLWIVRIGGENIFLQSHNDTGGIFFHLALHPQNLESFGAKLDSFFPFVVFNRSQAKLSSPLQKPGLFRQNGLEQTDGIAPVPKLHGAFGF